MGRGAFDDCGHNGDELAGFGFEGRNAFVAFQFRGGNQAEPVAGFSQFAQGAAIQGDEVGATGRGLCLFEVGADGRSCRNELRPDSPRGWSQRSLDRERRHHLARKLKRSRSNIEGPGHRPCWSMLRARTAPCATRREYFAANTPSRLWSGNSCTPRARPACSFLPSAFCLLPLQVPPQEVAQVVPVQELEGRLAGRVMAAGECRNLQARVTPTPFVHEQP